MTGLRKILIICCIICGTCVAKSDDADWGTLKGQLVITGPIPKPKKLEVLRDEDVCGQHELLDESLIVNSTNRGIRNIAVWLYSKKEIPIHPDLKESADLVTLDNKNCRFEPRMFKVRTGQQIQALNSDPIAHNVACYAVRNEPFNLNLSGSKPTMRSFSRPELTPLRIECSIHPWMRSYVVVSQHPYVAITDKDGRFEISKIPQGEWEFRFWHENNGYLKTLNTDHPLQLKRGRCKLKITRDGLNLGRATIPVKELINQKGR